MSRKLCHWNAHDWRVQSILLYFIIIISIIIIITSCKRPAPQYAPAHNPFLPPWAPKRLAAPSRRRLQSADVATSRKGLKGVNCYVLFFSTQRTPLVFVSKATCRRIVHCGKDCMHKLSSFWWSHHIIAVDRQIPRQLTARFLLAVIS